MAIVIVFAHLGHWYCQLLFVAPVAVLVVWLRMFPARS